MGEYFRAWKRKLGLSSLVMALVFLSGWGRSQFAEDSISIPFGDQVTYHARLTRSGLEVTKTQVIHADSDEQLRIVGNRIFVEPIGSILDPGEGSGSSPDNPSDTNQTYSLTAAHVVCEFGRTVIPYWWLTTPLTIVSAWLLLSKSPEPPRTAKQVTGGA